MFSSIRGKIIALRQRLGTSNKTIFTLAVTLIIVVALPLIVLTSQQEQDLRQRASELVTPPFPTFPPTIFGKAASFDGSKNYISIEKANAVNTNGDFTLEGWINPSSEQIDSEGFYRSGFFFSALSSSTKCDGILMYTYSNYNNGYNIYAQTPDEENRGYLLKGEVSNLNQWVHVALTYNIANKTAQLFVNGNLKSSSILSKNLCNAEKGFNFGPKSNYPAKSSFKGLLDEMRISNSVRYISNFTPSLTPFSSDSNTIGLYHFDDNVNDASGNGNNGQSVGNVQFVDSTIVAATISLNLLSPSGNSNTWPIGSAQTVTWSSSNIPSNIAMSLYLNDVHVQSKEYKFPLGINNGVGKFIVPNSIPLGSYWLSITANKYSSTPERVSVTIASPSPTPIAGSSNRVFVTSTNYTGNLGGLSGADAKCQDRANTANLGGTWKAWLSDSTGSPSTRFNKSSNPYKLLNGTTIANNWADLTDNSLQNTISITEFGASIGGWYVWTYTNPDGNAITENSYHCQNWTSASAIRSNNGITGNNGYSNVGWTKTLTYLNCSSNDVNNHYANIHLYCFEQSVAPSPTPTPLACNYWIGGTVYEDVNKDGQFDQSPPQKKPFVDKALSGVSVALYQNGKFMSRALSVNSGYSFKRLCTGVTYELVEEKKEGWKVVEPTNNKYTITVANKNVPNLDFGNISACGNYGDVDLNGTISAADANLVLRFITGSATPTAEQKKRADLNVDGKITILDSVLLQQFLSKKITTFPACSK